jgi:hypothetical protein
MYDNSVRLIGFLGQNAEKRTARNKTPLRDSQPSNHRPVAR